MRVNHSEIPSSSANFVGGQNEANGMPVQKKKRGGQETVKIASHNKVFEISFDNTVV